MRNLLLLLLLPAFLIISSCDDDSPKLESTGDIELVVKANYDGELFQTQKEYEYIPGMAIKFTEFNFFVANISLLEEESSTDEKKLTEIDFIDLSYNVNQTDQALAGDKITTQKVPVGTYRGFKIGFGVPANLNSTRPADYGENDVLNTATHFWSPLNSYIFSKIEGFSDNNGNGVFESTEGEGLRYHLGQNEVYTEKVIFLNDPIIIKEDGAFELVLNLDVKKLFSMSISEFDVNGDNLLDIEMYNQSHGDTEAQEFLVDKQLMGNFGTAFTLEQ